MHQRQINYDCIYYSGYKPCRKAESCQDCPHYTPQGTRVLIIKLAAMGDVLRTTPILQGLKKKYPQSYITWVTDKDAYDLLKTNPHINRLLEFDPESALILQAEEFDLLLNFEKEQRALALAKLINAKEKLGFALTPEGTLGCYNDESCYALMLGLSDELKFCQNTKTYPEIIFEMARLPYEGEEYVLPLTSEAASFGKEFKEEFSLDRFKFIIGINTGTGRMFKSKRWTIKGFVDLIRTLSSYPQLGLILLGGPLEKEFNKEILADVEELIIDGGCNNSLQEFIGLINCCDLVVSADSLAMHIAIGLKKKVVVFFGPTCPQEVDLFGRGEKILAELDCSPCYLPTCDKKPNCMELLKADQVAQAVFRQLPFHP